MPSLFYPRHLPKEVVMSVIFTGEIITSRQNRRIVELVKLDDRKAREAGHRFRFDGITSIQSVDLIPLPENGREEGLTPSDTQFFEGENPDL